MKSQLMLQESKQKSYQAGKWKAGDQTKVDAGVPSLHPHVTKVYEDNSHWNSGLNILGSF